MKRSFLAICLGALFFAGCKEVPPYIKFNNANYVDTFFQTTTPSSTDLHNVLAEEFTGEGCTNCPYGHTILDNSASANPGRVNIISLYETGFGVLIPPNGAAYDFRDSAAYEIGSSAIYNGVNSFPIGGIDRVPISGTPGNLLSDANWAGAISTRLTVADSFNMAVSSLYAGGQAAITVTIIYTSKVLSPQNISVAVVEDSIVDFQDMFPTVDSSYVFNDVFVGLASTLPYGDPLPSTLPTRAGGLCLQRTYTYTIPTSFAKGLVNPSHCRVVAFVNSPGTNGDYEVYQSVQCKLVGP